MNKLKLTAFFASVLFILSLVTTSCEKPLKIDENVFTNKGIPMNGSQVVPPNASTATGTLDVKYVRADHLLTYTVTWTGLSGPPAAGAGSGAFASITFPAIGVYGIADFGYMAFPYPPQQPTGLSNYPNGAAQTVSSGFTAAVSGSYTGTLFIDNTAIKESDLLNGKFYLQIRTAAFPNGQIRGQIYFL
jgi:hypothetical protein